MSLPEIGLIYRSKFLSWRLESFLDIGLGHH